MKKKKNDSQYIENINNDLLINVSRRIRILLCQKLLDRRTALAPKPESASVLPR